MPYITIDDYVNFAGPTVPDNFEVLAGVASDMVNQMTGHKINMMRDLPEQTQIQIKKAVCAQVQWIDQHGGIVGEIASASLGKFSFSSTGPTLEYSPVVSRYLAPTGLLFTGVIVS